MVVCARLLCCSHGLCSAGRIQESRLAPRRQGCGIGAGIGRPSLSVLDGGVVQSFIKGGRFASCNKVGLACLALVWRVVVGVATAPFNVSLWF